MRYKTFDDVNYDEIVPEMYRLNPDTDDVIYADELEDGMIVLTVGTYRVDEDNPVGKSDYLLQQNRWCVVTKLRKELEVIEVPSQDLVTEMIDGTKDIVVTKSVTFIGLYSDGNKEIRPSQPEQGWIVRKHTTSLAQVTEEVRKANQERRKVERE